jgi:hypothetical protein
MTFLNTNRRSTTDSGVNLSNPTNIRAIRAIRGQEKHELTSFEHELPRIDHIIINQKMKRHLLLLAFCVLCIQPLQAQYHITGDTLQPLDSIYWRPQWADSLLNAEMFLWKGGVRPWTYAYLLNL